MSDFQPYSREQEDADQRDPTWLDWLGRMDSQLEKFFTETVPDMPRDRWSVEGLDHAARAAVSRFGGSPDDTERPENSDVVDQFCRYLGEVFVRNAEGRWFNMPDIDRSIEFYHGFGPVVTFGYSDAYLDVGHVFNVAVYQPKSEHWSRIYGFTVEDCAAWVAAGRPPLGEWIGE